MGAGHETTASTAAAALYFLLAGGSRWRILDGVVAHRCFAQYVPLPPRRRHLGGLIRSPCHTLACRAIKPPQPPERAERLAHHTSSGNLGLGANPR